MNRRHARIVVTTLLSLGLLASLPLGAHYAQSAQAQKQNPVVQFKPRQHNHAQDGQQSADEMGSSGFVIVRGEHGTQCRSMTSQEEQALTAVERSASLQPIGEERRTQLQQQTGLKINLRATSQLNNFTQARDSFLRAAAKWEAIIQSPITVVLDVDFGPTLFGFPYPSDDIIGATDPQQVAFSNLLYANVRTALLAASASTQQTAVYNALSTGNLPTELGNTTNVSATTANFRALGLLPAVANPNLETSLGDPPAIGFNSAFAYDFDPSDGIDADKLDFEAAAVHEIGHALGFITYMGNKELPGQVNATLFPTPWDIFRLRPGGLVLSSLGNKQRAQVSGGEQVFFAGGEEYALSTGTVAGTGGDGQQGSHWKDDALTGQYIGTMDPTGTEGDRDVLTAADLTALNSFGYKINPSSKVYEVLTVSDRTFEERQNRANAMVVNRYTPPRYPATLESLRVLIPAPLDGSSPLGQQLRVIAFADPNRTGQPPANPSLLVNQTLTITALPVGSRVLEVLIPNGPVINGGDVYVGVQTSSGSVPIAADSNGQQRLRSFISTNNGQSWQTLMTLNAPTPATVNFIARALISTSFGTAAPGALTLSPSAVAPGGPALTLSVFGSNFQQNSVVRVNNSDRQTTFLSGSLLQAQIPASDIAAAGTAKVTVFTPSPGGGETVAVDLAITANNPTPTLTRLDPPLGAVGASNVTLNVFGTNFNAQSRIRVNGNERQTTLVSSTQLSTTLAQADQASAATLSISVANPTPGGGASNALTFSVVVCSFGISINNQAIFASATPTAGNAFGSGFILSASNNACPWTATSSDSWLGLTSPTSGVGRSVVNFSVQSQPSFGATPREARLTVGNQTITVRQRGRASAVSGASFNTLLAAEAIAAVFGTNIAKETKVAESTPLPTALGGASVLVEDSRLVRRNAPLFFVSAGQNNFQIPQGTATGSGFVIVTIDGQEYADSRVNITSSAPGIFTFSANGQGIPTALILRVKADNSQIFEPVAEFNQAMGKFVAKPIDFGAESDKLFLILYGTGLRGRASLNAVALQIGGVSIATLFVGAQGALVGLDQVNTVELPRSLAGRGEVNLTGTVDGRAINTTTLTFK